MKKTGVIGLGIIGKIWAAHYEAAGVLAATWNRTPIPDFVKGVPTVADVAQAADLIHIVIADPPAVASVVEQLIPKLGPGKCVVQSSTIDPESSDTFKALVEKTGARYLEAPFTGSKPAAEAKKTVFYFGGDEGTIHEAEPTLTLLSEVRFRIGTNRQASALKLAMNMNIAAQFQALCESLTLARDAGISDDTFFQVLQRNVSLSGVATLKEPKLKKNDFSPQFSVKHLLKDLRLASRTAGCREYPVLDTVRERFHLAAQKGLSEEDFAALITLM